MTNTTKRYVYARAFYIGTCIFLVALISGCISQDNVWVVPYPTLVPSATVLSSPTSDALAPSMPGLMEPNGEFSCVGGIWQGIHLGTTTEERLLSWLETSPFIDRTSVTENQIDIHQNGIEVHEFWLPLDTNEWLYIGVISDTVSSLRSPAQYPVDIGVIVSALGEPEYVSASFSSQGDDCVYGLTVYYPELGIRFYADLYNQCDIVSHDPETGFSVGPLAPDILVRSIECHQPGTLVESLMAVGWTLQQAEMIADRTQEWPGWGYIQLLEPES